MHAPNHIPADGLPLKLTHDPSVQHARAGQPVHVGVGGTIHDYVPFYFGLWSPMMLKLHTGQVDGYREGQRPLVYLASTAQAVVDAGSRFIFTDGQALAQLSEQFDDLRNLPAIDWKLVGSKYWHNRPDDGDRQRRKQAEFLIRNICPVTLIQGFAVINNERKQQAEKILSEFGLNIPVEISPGWYY